MPTAPALRFNTDFLPQTGLPIEVAPGVVRITAPNSGPYTFTGTNSFLIGGRRLFVLDPGPDDDSHLAALLRAIGGREVQAILLTHTHRDHSALAPRLQAATGAPLWFEGEHRLSRHPAATGPQARSSGGHWELLPDRRLADGDRLDAGDRELTVVTTPGHCANHIAFGTAGWLFSGDHVMGWNSTLVPVPDGSMADYLQSLRKVIALPYERYLPAHGGAIDEARDYARALLAHRERRNTQVVVAVKGGATRLDGLLEAIYPRLPSHLRAAALMTLRSQIEYLAERGDVTVEDSGAGLCLS